MLQTINFLKYNLLLLLLVALTSCGGDVTCYDADDFGFTTIAVSSRYKPADIIGTQANEVAPWIDHNLILSGKTVLIMVKNWYYGEDLNNSRVVSAWCPWWGVGPHANILSSYCKRLRQCSYLNNEMCHNPVITNSPCLMKKGVGLYVDLEQNGAASPNATHDTIVAPQGITMHLGEPMVGFAMYDFSGTGIQRPAGGVLYNYDGNNSLNSSRLNYVGGKMYFKILDSYYDDNNGQYLAVIKSGLQEPGDDLFSMIENMVQERLFGNGDPNAPTLDKNGVVRTIFQNILTAPGYSTTIRAALILYISLTSILFMIGSIQLTHTEVINRVIKVAIITVLLNPTISWDFFNEYLFLWFYQGSAYLIHILKDSANIGPGDSSILTFLTTIQIFTKLISLLLSTWQGWIYIIIYFIMLIFLTVILFDAAVLYMTAQVMMGLLICLAPIFIAFYLFESTKSFFENWLKQLTGYAIQCIMVSAGILFLTMIIRNQIYNTLGFRVCLKEFPDMTMGGSGGLNNLLQGSNEGDVPVISLFAWWFPQIPGWHDNPIKAVIPIPKAHFVSPQDASLGFGFTQNDLGTGDFCSAYECLGSRYPDLPFLDPNNPYEARQMDILRSGNVADFGGLFIVVVCVFLLHHFNSTVQSISRFLSGTTGNVSDNSTAAHIVSGSMLHPVHAATAAIDRASGFKGFRDKKSQDISDLWNKKIVGAAAASLSNWRAKRLEDYALNATELKVWHTHVVGHGLLAKAEAKTGISQAEARKFRDLQAQYKRSLGNVLGANGMNGANSSRLDNKASDILKSLNKHGSAEFESVLAKKLYGKDVDISKLSSAERANIQNIMKDDAVQKIVLAKQKEEFFKQAYVESYTEMGKGALSSREIAREKRSLQAEKNVALSSEMKRWFSGGLVGGDADKMLSQDLQRRTYNEQIADKESALKAQTNSRAINSLIFQAGRDIERPDFMSKVRNIQPGDTLSGYSYQQTFELRNNIERYDKAIADHIETDVQRRFKDSGVVKGDTYIKTQMTDQEFDLSVQNAREYGAEILKNDKFIKNENLYKNDAAAMQELNNRKALISKAIEGEIQRLHDVRDADIPEKSTFLKDVDKASEGAQRRPKRVFNAIDGKLKQIGEALDGKPKK